MRTSPESKNPKRRRAVPGLAMLATAAAVLSPAAASAQSYNSNQAAEAKPASQETAPQPSLSTIIKRYAHGIDEGAGNPYWKGYILVPFENDTGGTSPDPNPTGGATSPHTPNNPVFTAGTDVLSNPLIIQLRDTKQPFSLATFKAGDYAAVTLTEDKQGYAVVDLHNYEPSMKLVPDTTPGSQIGVVAFGPDEYGNPLALSRPVTVPDGQFDAWSQPILDASGQPALIGREISSPKV